MIHKFVKGQAIGEVPSDYKLLTALRFLTTS